MPSYLLRRDLIFWYLQDDLDVFSLLVNVRFKECGKWRRGDFAGSEGAPPIWWGSKLKVLLTRPVERVSATVSALAAHRISSISDPMLAVEPLRGVTIQLRQCQALLVTSVTAADLLSSIISDRMIRVYAVGAATAGKLLARGFQNVKSADGDVWALFDLVKRCSDPLGGRLVHVGGEEIAGNLVDNLRACGFCTEHIVAYRVQEAVAFAEHTLLAFEKGEVEAVLFFSPRSARAFARVLGSQKYPWALGIVRAFCLSRTVADEIKGIGWAQVVVSQQPTMASLIESISVFSASFAGAENA